jgi:S-sulfo-L-cysteine synthase (O-acetyl-L-serine-dependent)
MATGAIPYRKEARAGSGLLDQIGNTPLVELASLTSDLPGIEILAKLEFLNPGGSVKDRPGLNILNEAEESGCLKKGQTILDSTSGNTGIAYAMVGAAKGYHVALCLPRNVSSERKRILEALGAELIFSDPAQGSDGSIRLVREIRSQDPDKYFYADQYSNDANWLAHFKTTGPEIIRQTEGRITHFVTLLGTTGTFIGTSRRLKRDVHGVECWSAQPATPLHGIEGAKHLPTSIVPKIYDSTIADGNFWIQTEDCHAMVKRMARTEGLLLGISAAGNLVAARKLAEKLASQNRRGVIVTIACDGVSKYLSESFWTGE